MSAPRESDAESEPQCPFGPTAFREILPDVPEVSVTIYNLMSAFGAFCKLSPGGRTDRGLRPYDGITRARRNYTSIRPLWTYFLP
jgi:hypothetical protein